MVWTDFQTAYDADTEEEMRERPKKSGLSADELMDQLAAMRPYCAFNAQLVELTTSE